ncbi:MAG: DUF3656 domain-containing protein [Oscillospiraceae bacterium]|nr:DUF3656 domain-containing protein [Oscillospiraceae bacterium]
MLELLSPAGSPESVIAAVQNGADAVYLGMSGFNARQGAKNFTDEEFKKAVRYCRIRGCKVYVALNTLVNDREIRQAVDMARIASAYGADGLIVQDLGLISALREAVPDLPIHGSTQMSVHSLAGVEAAAAMGITRVVLARELSLEQIRFITKHASIETEVFVHGALCFCHSGQCYMSSLIGRRSGNRGSCAQPCRMQYSLGGRMDDHPLSLKDNCLVTHLRELEDAGVACVKIEGRAKRPEYSGIVTGIYSRAIREQRLPSDEEMEQLRQAFSRSGFTDGYFLGTRKDMDGIRTEEEKRNPEAEKLFAAARNEYGNNELRRVPISFASVVRKGEQAKAIAYDNDGHKAFALGPVPERARKNSITEESLREQMFKTGGTPYDVISNQAQIEEGLFLPSSEINNLRRQLISEISEQRAAAPKRRNLPLPAAPASVPSTGNPVTIYQVSTEEQLCPELAELKPEYLYAPALLLAAHPEKIDLFTANGTKVVAVLPRIITDNQVTEVYSALEQLFQLGINEALVGNIGHIMMVRRVGMNMRGDFGLNAFNAYSMDVLKKIGFLSATASFELRIAQIRDMPKPLPAEMIVYGRLPLMVSDQCVISKSAGRCACQTPAQLSDRTGNVFPVVKEFGCRNVIYNAHRLYLADKKEDIYSCGLWGMRLLFTTESSRECAEVAKGYKNLSDYKPNALTRGLYYRGVD